MVACPRFSIVVPVYNKSRFIVECLDSIAGQTCGSYEVILVDDGSTDGSLAICENYAVGRSNFSVLHQDNAGPFSARVRGVEHATGDFVVFVDADDLLDRRALEECEQVILRYNPDVLAVEYLEFTEDAQAAKASRLKPGIYERSDYMAIKELICEGRLNNLCSKVIRRSLIDVSDYPEASIEVRFGEDLISLLPIIDKAKSYYHCPEHLYSYRMEASSVTAGYSSKKVRDLAIVAQLLRLYGSKWGGACRQKAKQGGAAQYSYLARIAVKSTTGSHRKEALAEIGKQMRKLLDLEIIDPHGARIDVFAICTLILHGHYAPLPVIVATLDWVKQIQWRRNRVVDESYGARSVCSRANAVVRHFSKRASVRGQSRLTICR